LIVTVLVGLLTLAEFSDPKRMARMPAAVPLVALHLLLALGSAVVWTIFLVVDSTAMGWVGFLVILATAAAGLLLFTRSNRFEATDEGEEIRVVSPGFLVVHGVVAAVTVVLALLAAAGGGR
jgi:hypothetical protein